MEIPVYIFTGFLESGKTTFMQHTMCDDSFSAGERYLLLVCEDGMEQLQPERFANDNVVVEYLEDESQLSREYIDALYEKHHYEAMVIEYNGMWQTATLSAALPDTHIIYQVMLFADARSFLSYNDNMRQLVADKISVASVCVFNRCDDSTDQLQLHRIVRALSRGCDIAYEYNDGRVEYDDIEDPLPFDKTAELIDIKNDDYALWYRDIMDNLPDYEGRRVRFVGIAARDDKMPQNSFAAGRHIMTCCVNDITYGGVVCKYAAAATIKTGGWYRLSGVIKVERDELYRAAGPVVYVEQISLAERPDPQVATFY